MRLIWAIFTSVFLISCAPAEFAGVATVDETPMEMRVRAASTKSWLFFVNGEEIGLFEENEPRKRDGSHLILEFAPLATKYGEFDATLTYNLSAASVSAIFSVYLDGRYVGTVSGNL